MPCRRRRCARVGSLAAGGGAAPVCLGAVLSPASQSSTILLFPPPLQLYIRRLTEDTAQQLPGAVPRKVEEPVAAPEPVLGATARAWAVRRWNEVSIV